MSGPPVRDLVVIEGDVGLRLTGFLVTLSAPSPSPVTVGFATGGGTATPGIDYQPRAGTLTFAPGQTTRFIVVRIVGDTLIEPLETFAVALFNPSGAEIEDGVAFAAIVNDDP